MNEILEKSNKNDSRVARTSCVTSLHLSKNRGESISRVEYSRVIGRQLYLMNCIILDTVYMVRRLSRCMSNLNSDLWNVIVWLLRYLRYIRNYYLHYTKYIIVFEG